MDLYSNQPLTRTDASRIRDHFERVAEEEREWREARLHHALHGNWLSSDECATCLYEAEKPDLNLEGDPTRNGAFG